jgi:aspartyl-tRNA(Asn)/glutamyl-tRNA(Gln) amidotransferase subunit A
MNLDKATASTLKSALESGETSSVALTQYYLERIQSLNPQLNCVITTTAQSALERAQDSDDRRKNGIALSALDGIPMLHKDVFCTAGVATTCGSRMLENFESPYDATVVRRCAEAGLVMLGKANMDEFAMGSSNEHSYFGPARNPWDTERVPGGSSGGSAGAVAAGMAPLATGTDTGGSIRQPAAFCGLTGIKPTYGRVSRHGMVAFASSLDQGGFLTHSALDAATALNIIAGHDPLDSTSSTREAPDFTADLAKPVAGLRVGIDEHHFGAGLDSSIGDGVREAAASLQALGATLHDVHLSEADLTVPTYYVIALAEASSNLSRYDGVRFGHRAKDVEGLEDLYERSRAEGFGNEVKRRIMLGTYALSAGYYDAYYRKAQQLRRLICEDYARMFESVDVLLSPVAPTGAFKLGKHISDPVQMYLSDIYTCGINLAGLPAVAFPVGNDQGLPVGAQLVGRPFEEDVVLNAVHQYQSATEWHHLRAPASDAKPGAST